MIARKAYLWHLSTKLHRRWKAAASLEGMTMSAYLKWALRERLTASEAAQRQLRGAKEKASTD